MAGRLQNASAQRLYHIQESRCVQSSVVLLINPHSGPCEGFLHVGFLHVGPHLSCLEYAAIVSNGSAWHTRQGSSCIPHLQATLPASLTFAHGSSHPEASSTSCSFHLYSLSTWSSCSNCARTHVPLDAALSQLLADVHLWM